MAKKVVSSSQRQVAKKEKGDEAIPFDEALRRMVNAPPQHKTAKKPTEPKTE